MKLYITPGSPYARMARIMVLEKGLETRVEIIQAQTRTAGSPYYLINPSGRVPYLVTDDGVGLEESAVICRYLDLLDGQPAFTIQPDDWEAARLGALASSLMDGVAVLGREVGRASNEQSPGIVRHEIDRAGRLIDRWESEIDAVLMRGPLNPVQIALACGLGLERRYQEFRWRDGHPKLVAWYDRISARPSFANTLPPLTAPAH